MNNNKTGGTVAKAKKGSAVQAQPEVPPPTLATKEQNRESADEVQRYRDEAWQLEMELEKQLLKDAVFAARLALQDLQAETYSGQPHERRKGMRIREKAMKVDRAFNRLRALRKGDLLPTRHDDEW